MWMKGRTRVFLRAGCSIEHRFSRQIFRTRRQQNSTSHENSAIKARGKDPLCRWVWSFAFSSTDIRWKSQTSFSNIWIFFWLEKVPDKKHRLQIWHSMFLSRPGYYASALAWMRFGRPGSALRKRILLIWAASAHQYGAWEWIDNVAWSVKFQILHEEEKTLMEKERESVCVKTAQNKLKLIHIEQVYAYPAYQCLPMPGIKCG